MKKHHERKEGLERPALQMAQKIKEAYGIRDTEMWDAEMAADASEKLTAEEAGLKGLDLRRALLQRWLDAFAPKGGDQAESRLAREHVIEAVPLRYLTSELIYDKSRTGKTIDALRTDGRSTTMPLNDRDLVSRVYGTDVLVGVKTAGTWAKIHQDQARLIGSPKFSCCTALAGVSEAGDLCFAHVPGPGSRGVREVGAAILENKFGPGRYVMISPERRLREGAPAQKQELAQELNEEFVKLAQELGIQRYAYTEMYPDEDSVLKDIRIEFAMLMTKNGLQVQKTERIPSPGVRRGYLTEVIDEVIAAGDEPELDIEFGEL